METIFCIDILRNLARSSRIRYKLLLDSSWLIVLTHPNHSRRSLWLTGLVRLPAWWFQRWCVATFRKGLCCMLVNIDSFWPRTLLTRKTLRIRLWKNIFVRMVFFRGPIINHDHFVVKGEATIYGPERLSKVRGWAGHVIISILGLLLAQKTEFLYILVFN